MTELSPSIHIRRATIADVPEIVRLLADDILGQERECYQDPLPQSYYDAFADINADHNNYLMVVEQEQHIIGTVQMVILTNLSYRGRKRGQIEGVRIEQTCRGLGLGKLMIEWCVNKSRELDCHMVQLTMDKKRLKTIEFYKKLGFHDTHEGLKLLI